MDPIKLEALRMAATRGLPLADTVTTAVAYEQYLYGARSSADSDSEKPINLRAAAEAKAEPRQKYPDAQNALLEAIASAHDFEIKYPELRDFLNAEMPSWLAKAAYEEMRRRGGLLTPGSAEMDRLGREWSEFVISFAGHLLGRFNDHPRAINFPR